MNQDYANEGGRNPVAIVLGGVSKRFPGGTLALESIDLKIEPGERLVVLGPSGSGKSTLLRLIAGLEPMTAGRILIDGRDQAEIPPHGRELAMIFQNPSLFPHLSVYENLAFGLRPREKADKIVARVIETAAMLRLSDLLDRRPEALSGGERQRVAIGRAIAWRPRILLLDEPFSGLDAPLRASLRDEVVAMHRRFGMTLIHVTHDQGEALAMGDRIAVLNRGQLMQCDTPRRIYERPVHRFIGEFVGSPPMNILPCEVVRESNSLRFYLIGKEPMLLGIDHQIDRYPFSSLGIDERRRLYLGTRPEHVTVLRENSAAAADREGAPAARVERVEFQGHETWIRLLLGGHAVKSRISGWVSPREGEDVQVFFAFLHASWFDPETGFAVVAVDNPFAERDRA